MKFSENWLRELVDIPVDREALAHRLTMAGLEVENIEPLGMSLDKVLVAEIITCEQHPNADKLRICQVSVGQSDLLSIVCGAPNARVGLKVPLAMIGAKLGNGIEIKKAALRGVESNGMLCSAKELGLDADASGLLELPTDAPVGQTIAAYLTFPDASIELKLTPNRPDCLSMRGLAYDVAALFEKTPPSLDTFNVSAPVRTTSQRHVQLQAGGDCPRYVGRIIEGVDIKAKTPLWMAERLRRAGIRPISAVVDVTQYVMLELGQPMHAFDNDKLQGAIVVRRAQDGEVLTLLDSSENKLDSEFLVIADEQHILALAGIMGGHESRVSESTQNVFLESAYFAPPAIMGRARRLGLHTDASHRFERGVDPELPRVAIERATQLLIGIAGGTAGPLTESILPEFLPKRDQVHLRRQRLTQLLGVSVDDAKVESILKTLGFAVERANDGWKAIPPSFRFDIEIEEDLIEEVARVYGYELIPTHLPRGELTTPEIPECQLELSCFQPQLVARDYVEAICFTFVAVETLQIWDMQQGAIRLANPLSADLAVMRTSLLPGLVAALAANQRRQQDRVRLFESGRVFHQGDDAPIETLHLAAVACGSAVNEQWGEIKRPLDFFDIKGDLESVIALTGATVSEFTFGAITDIPYLHPGRSARVLRAGKPIGIVGMLHPRLLNALGIDSEIAVFEVNLDLFNLRKLPQVVGISKFPSIRRDIAVVLPEEVAYAEIEASIRDAAGTKLMQIRLFDQFFGKNLGNGVKSIAISLILQDSSSTLTDQEADHCVASVVTALENRCKAKLRG